MQNKEDSSVNIYLNGLGLGSIAAAMYLIQKADFNPSDIHIFEQMGAKDLVGGSCDASEVMVNKGARGTARKTKITTSLLP